MSDEEAQFKDGLDRGASGKASSTPLDIATMFDSPQSKAARQRGFESGVAIKALRDAQQANQSDSSSSGQSVGSGRTFGGKEMSEQAFWTCVITYFVLLVASFFLVQAAATWSLVWWLSVLMLISGIPVFFMIVAASLYLIAGLTILAAIVALVDYFAGNLF